MHSISPCNAKPDAFGGSPPRALCNACHHSALQLNYNAISMLVSAICSRMHSVDIHRRSCALQTQWDSMNVITIHCKSNQSKSMRFKCDSCPCKSKQDGLHRWCIHLHLLCMRLSLVEAVALPWFDADFPIAPRTPYHLLEIVRLGIPRLGTRRKQKQGFYEKVIWPPMALRIGLLRSLALQNDGLDAPVILQCRTPQETNPKGHWGPNSFSIKSLCLLPPCA